MEDRSTIDPAIVITGSFIHIYFQMQSGLKVVAILYTTVFLQCHGSPKHMEKDKKNLSYQVLLEDYKEASLYKCPEALTPLDGCSLPAGKSSIFYRDMFTPACLRHDICYRCVRISEFPVVFLYQNPSLQ